jgi:cobalamin-dependent methionine synthase I
MKKQRINRQIYHLNILLANTWGNTWLCIQKIIEEKLKKLIQLKYKHLDKNLSRLVQEQTKTPKQIHTFYPTVVNNTNITVTNNEIKLLEKDHIYNLHSQRKTG